MVFKANNASITAMHEVLDSMADGETTQFILANYAVADVTKEQLKKAYDEAVSLRTSLMVKPYAE